MLRRRKRSQRKDTRPPRAPVTTSRRRARPDAAVPSELLIAAVEEDEPNRGQTPQTEQRQNRGLTPVVLVTGFDPFDRESTNPSWEVCKRLPATIAGLRVETCRV